MDIYLKRQVNVRISTSAWEVYSLTQEHLLQIKRTTVQTIMSKLMLTLDSLLNPYIVLKQQREGAGRGNIELDGFIAMIPTLGAEAPHWDDGRVPPPPPLYHTHMCPLHLARAWDTTVT